jgi:hypothetical protein
VDAETGLAGTLIGSATGYTYSATLANGYVFYTETTTAATATVKTYGDTAANIVANKKGVEIVNADYVKAENYIVSLDEVYTLAEGTVYKSTLVGDDKVAKEIVAKSESISAILFVKDGNVYYTTSENKIARLALSNGDANEVIVSKGTASSAWYAPEIIELGGKDYLFYLDNSALGASYVKSVDLSSEVVAEDTDDNGEDDKFYLDSEVLVGKVIEADKAKIVEAQIGEITTVLENGVLSFETVDGKLTVAAVTEARAAYDALAKDVKALVAAASVETLEDYEKAIEMANLYAKLDGMYGYVNKTSDEQTALKNAYNEVKAEIEKFKASEEYEKVSVYISNNMLWNYQQAVKTFEADK